MYAIQGLSFQRHSMGNIAGALDTILGADPNVVIQFTGGIFKGPPPAYELQGNMRDHFGLSVLSEITIERDRVSFLKTYGAGNNHQAFEYEFKKQGNFWIGTFRSTREGSNFSGSANCILTEVDEAFFEPQFADNTLV